MLTLEVGYVSAGLQHPAVLCVWIWLPAGGGAFYVKRISVQSRWARPPWSTEAAERPLQQRYTLIEAPVSVVTGHGKCQVPREEVSNKMASWKPDESTGILTLVERIKGVFQYDMFNFNHLIKSGLLLLKKLCFYSFNCAEKRINGNSLVKLHHFSFFFTHTDPLHRGVSQSTRVGVLHVSDASVSSLF